MQKKRGLILFILSLIIIGLMYSKRKPEAPEMGANKIPVPRTSVEFITENDLQPQDIVAGKEIGKAKELPEKTLDQVLEKYSKDELELLSNASKSGVNLKTIKTFIEQSKGIKDREVLVKLAKVISPADLFVKIELMKWINSKFPKVTPELKKEQKPVKKLSLFNKIKKT